MAVGATVVLSRKFRTRFELSCHPGALIDDKLVLDDINTLKEDGGMGQVTSEVDDEPAASVPVGPKRTVLWAAELRERWGVSSATLWRWRRAGRIPAPDFQGTGWLVATIVAFEQGDTTGAQGASTPRRSH